MRTVKTPDIDNRVVDYLYDDLSDAQREAFAAQLEADEDAAGEASSFASILKLYREESEELSPSVATTERLLKQAALAHQSLWSRLFGGLPQLILRPAAGVAVMAVLVIGVGTFVFFRKAEDPAGPTSRDQVAPISRSEGRSVPASRTAQPKGSTAVAERSRDEKPLRGAARADEDQFTDATLKSGEQNKAALVLRQVADRPLDNRNYKAGAIAGKDRRARRLTLDGLRGRKTKRAAANREPRFKTNLAPLAAPVHAAPKKPALAVSQQGSKDGSDKAQVVQKPAPKQLQEAPSSSGKATPPALHNEARKNLAKGKVATACRLYGSLVRQHRGYLGRADALLGWSRCELARGNFDQAELLIRQLMSEHPKWRKSAYRWLAEIRRQRSRIATKSARRARRPAKRRPARRAPPRARVRAAADAYQ
ncbi:MAG: hypothetical protein ABI333_11965 [bacterium]